MGVSEVSEGGLACEGVRSEVVLCGGGKGPTEEGGGVGRVERGGRSGEEVRVERKESEAEAREAEEEEREDSCCK